ncbi:MAG: AI-2E family transporter [Rhodoferax sp.]
MNASEHPPAAPEPPAVPGTAAAGSTAGEATVGSPRRALLADRASLGAVLVLALFAMHAGLLAGVLAVCTAVLLTQGLGAAVQKLHPRLGRSHAAALVIAVWLLLTVALLARAKGWLFGFTDQYPALLRHLGATVLEIRQKLPAEIAVQLPDGLEPLQAWLAHYLQSRAAAITGMGTRVLHVLLLVFAGLVVGALVVGTPRAPQAGVLAQAMRVRGQRFMQAFTQIVVAQFWIAVFNTACTALFLLALLPAFGTQMPYAGQLIAITFVTGLVPIVGNLVCNSIMTLAGLSVSVGVGLACLAFLVLIHKIEILINAKVVGQRTQTAAWELLLVIFAAEAAWGMAGLVAGPLLYAYAKQELQHYGWL